MTEIHRVESSRFHIAACLIIIIAGLIVYSNTIHSSFHFDDYKNIVDNPLIKDLRNIPQLFQANPYTSASRGMVTTTFAINHYFSGMSAEGYHWTNIAIHLLNGMLVYLLAIIILSLCVPDTGGRGAKVVPILALFVALLFVTSPVQTHTVNYIVQRNGELAATFYLLSFIFFTRAVAQDTLDVPRYVWSTVLFFIGIFCKEIVFTAFIMMFLYYLCFVSGGWHGWPRALKLVLPYVVLIALNLYLTAPYIESKPLGITVSGGEEKVTAARHSLQYPATEAGVIIEYVKLLAWPLPGNLNVDYDITPARVFWERSTVISRITVAGLFCSALIFLSRARLLAFSILWFLVILIPTSSIIQFQDYMVCYRLYLPGIGFYLLLVAGVYTVFRHLGERSWPRAELARFAGLGVLTGMVIFYAVNAHEHNRVWKSSVSLWEDAVKKSPDKIRPHYNLSKAYELSGILSKAKSNYIRSIEMFESKPQQRPLSGIESYYWATIALGNIYSREGRHAEAIDLYTKGLKVYPQEPRGHNNLGLAYYRAGRLEDAEREFQLVIRIKPDLSTAHENLGALYEVKGMSSDAMAALAEAVKADPFNANAHIRLGQLWWNYKKRPDMALVHMRAALRNSDLDEETSKNILNAIEIIEHQTLLQHGSGTEVPLD